MQTPLLRLSALPAGLLSALLSVPEGALQCLCDCGVEAQVRDDGAARAAAAVLWILDCCGAIACLCRS